MNTNPALSLDNDTLANMLPGVVDGALELVLGAQGPDRPPHASDEALLTSLPGRWRLLLEEKDPPLEGAKMGGGGGAR